MIDLVICVRCHKDPALIMDTIDSVRANVDLDQTAVFAAVDGRPKLAEKLGSFGIDTFCSSNAMGWGAGLFTLLCESILYSQQVYGFTHFLTIDYDTLFLRPGVDDLFLKRIDDTDIGLLGHCIPDNNHWKVIFGKEKDRIAATLGPIPETYKPGEGVQGGCMCLTQALIDWMSENGFFGMPKVLSKGYTTIADDHFISLVSRYAGLEIMEMGGALCCGWKPKGDPRGMEEKGVKVFHPIKMVTAFGAHSRSTELELRNYFRELRGRGPLL